MSFATASQTLTDLPILSDEEMEALSYYTRLGHETINYSLRNLRPLTPKLDDIIEKMDQVLKRQCLTNPLQLYRGIPDFTHHYGEPEVGQIISDWGYMSFSSNRDIAERFRSNHLGYSGLKGKPYLLQLQAPSGTPAINIEAVMQKPNEAEYILARHSKLRIEHIDTHDSLVIASLETSD